MSEGEQLVMPDFIAKAIEAQGRVPVVAVEAQARTLSDRDWDRRVAAGEPTLEQALRSRELFQRHIAPFATEVTK